MFYFHLKSDGRYKGVAPCNYGNIKLISEMADQNGMNDMVEMVVG